MNKLHRIRSPWHRFVFSLSVVILLVINCVLSRRARVHWVGRFKRPPRPERALFLILYVVGLLVLSPRQFVFWSLMLGGTLSIFLDLYMIYRVLPRRRAHWIG